MRTIFFPILLLIFIGPLAIAQQPDETQQVPDSNVQTTSPEQSPVTPQSTPKPDSTIDCQYQIPPDQKNIDINIVKTWSINAAMKSFDYGVENLDSALAALKLCYTQQGWDGFDEAMEQSGNLKAIKSQKLTVSSQVEGDVTIEAVKENQWKVFIPLEVVYQNAQQKLTQHLKVDILVSRKANGNLGIMQIIATPKRQATIEGKSTP